MLARGRRRAGSADRGRPRLPGRVGQAAARAAGASAGRGGRDRAAGDAQGTITVAGRSLLYVARTTPNGRIVLIRARSPGVRRVAAVPGQPRASPDWAGPLLAALLSYLLARRLTRPIGELAAATQRLASGETGVEVPVEGEDELAELGRSFNAMSVELAPRPGVAAQLPGVGQP